MKGNKTMYENIQTIPFEGAKSKNPYSFRYYDRDRVIGGNTMDKTFGLDGIAMHKAKVDFAFDLMQATGCTDGCILR